MKKIIGGAKYDTATAKKLGEWDNGKRYSGFDYCEESLYRTKSGKYFLHGYGGAKTTYAISSGDNNWSGSSQIVAMSRAAAMEWAEEHLDGDDYETAFGPVEEGTEQLCVTVSTDLKANLWKIAEQRRISISSLAEELLLKSVE